MKELSTFPGNLSDGARHKIGKASVKIIGAKRCRVGIGDEEHTVSAFFAISERSNEVTVECSKEEESSGLRSKVHGGKW